MKTEIEIKTTKSDKIWQEIKNGDIGEACIFFFGNINQDIQKLSNKRIETIIQAIKEARAEGVIR